MTSFKSAIAAALLTGLCVVTAQAQESKPNIILMMMDNYGWGEPGFYGGGILRGAPRSDYAVAVRADD